MVRLLGSSVYKAEMLIIWKESHGFNYENRRDFRGRGGCVDFSKGKSQ